jgi:hypothetical protein
MARAQRHRQRLFDGSAGRCTPDSGGLIGRTNLPLADIAYRNNSGLSPIARVAFLNQAFASGGFVDLGFDIDNSLVGFLGINTGLLYGAKVTATIQSGDASTSVSGLCSAGRREGATRSTTVSA